jgi:hypothetical protein
VSPSRHTAGWNSPPYLPGEATSVTTGAESWQDWQQVQLHISAMVNRALGVVMANLTSRQTTEDSQVNIDIESVMA